MKANAKHNDLISILRGISIIAIMLYHLIVDTTNAPAIIKTASQFGGAGVHIFFICSGFGLALSHIRKPLSPREFWAKRFFKVYTPYILVVIACFLIPFTYQGEDRVTALMSHVFLFKMFVPKYMESFSVPFWYMSTLFQFYLVFPLLIWAKARCSTRRFFSASVAISLLWAALTVALGVNRIRVWGSFFLQNLWEFSLGICLAERFHADPENWLPKFKLPGLAIGTVVTFIIYAVMSLVGGPLTSFNDFFSAASFGGACLLISRIGALKPIMRYFDSISFELYLLHSPIFAVFLKAFGKPYLSPALVLTACACAIVAADLYHRLLPSLTRSRR